jgi:predicted Zn-dependent protease
MLAMAALLACLPPVSADLEEEIEEGIGHWMAQAFIAQRGRLDQPPIEQWVSGLGNELLAHSPHRGLDYHFVVLDSPEVNGFALPGGWIFVTAGLLETMETEDELAAVMAHELGHIANRDFQRILLRTALWLGLTEVLRDNDRHDWVPVAQAGQLVETLSHSRTREAEADAEGARIAWTARYDPRAMSTFLGDEPRWSYLQTVFATHPHPDKRTRRLDEQFARLRA